LPLPIRPDQTVNVPKELRKVMKVKPKQAPNDGEHSRDPAFQSVVLPLKDESGHASDQSPDADEQSETCVCKDSVTAPGDLKHRLKSETARIICHIRIKCYALDTTPHRARFSSSPSGRPG